MNKKGLDLRWGQGIASRDRWMGTLVGIVFEQPGGRVIHLIARRGVLLSSKVSIGQEDVSHWDEEGVYLSLSTAEVLRLPRLDVGDGEAVRVPLGSWSRVVFQEAETLRLKGVRYTSETGTLTHLIAGPAGWSRKSLLVPLEGLREIEPHRLVVGADMSHLPEYRPDREIEKDVWEALYEHQPDAAMDMRGVSVEVANGVVVLLGNVRVSTTGEEVERLAGTVRGVVGVENRLISDWDLELAVASALARDGLAAGGKITVRSALGKVDLRGNMPSLEATESAALCAQAVPGVKEVEDLIAIDPASSSGDGTAGASQRATPGP